MTSWLHERLAGAREVVRQCGARLDFGCGDGELLVRLAIEPQNRAYPRHASQMAGSQRPRIVSAGSGHAPAHVAITAHVGHHRNTGLHL